MAEEAAVTFATTESGSSAYAFYTTHARLAQEVDPGLSITIRETGGSTENLELVDQGVVDVGVTSLDTAIEAYSGEGSYQGEPLENVRNSITTLLNAEAIAVRADSGIESIYDLHGQPFAPANQGSALYDRILGALNALGIEPEPFVGSLEDIINATRDGRIVGFGRPTPLTTPSADFLDLASSHEIRLLGYTDEDVATLQAEFPRLSFGVIPSGTFPGQTEDVTTTTILTSYVIRGDVNEDVAYRLTKAFWETIDQAAEETNYPAAEGRTEEDTVSTVDFLPLHPGAERFWSEIGALD